jgi:hypothetical protein
MAELRKAVSDSREQLQRFVVANLCQLTGSRTSGDLSDLKYGTTDSNVLRALKVHIP